MAAQRRQRRTTKGEVIGHFLVRAVVKIGSAAAALYFFLMQYFLVFLVCGVAVYVCLLLLRFRIPTDAIAPSDAKEIEGLTVALEKIQAEIAERLAAADSAELDHRADGLFDARNRLGRRLNEELPQLYSQAQDASSQIHSLKKQARNRLRRPVSARAGLAGFMVATGVYLVYLADIHGERWPSIFWSTFKFNNVPMPPYSIPAISIAAGASAWLVMWLAHRSRLKCLNDAMDEMCPDPTPVG